MSEYIKYHWDEFRDYCKEDGISLEHKDDWEPWWNIWVAAIKSVLGEDAHDG